ncbi:unnamed protein product [Chrysoparadoxa australica]
MEAKPGSRPLLGAQLQGREVLGADAMSAFSKVLAASKNVVALTGAGVSAESGVPTFRGAGGLWKTHKAQDLATPQAFAANPCLVWQFYNYRRELVRQLGPNPAHHAFAALGSKMRRQGRQLTVLTQNIDGLHQASPAWEPGAAELVELHGSLWNVKYASDTENFLSDRAGKEVWSCREVLGQGEEGSFTAESLPMRDGKLLRPAVVWFGENLDVRVMDRAGRALQSCDLLVVAGTSAVVYPAAGFASAVLARGGTVAEFNLEQTDQASECTFAFQGKAGELLPAAFGVEEEVGKAMQAS